jgi:hypothetical protein
MIPKEFYKIEFGNADSVSKKSVIRLLKHFAIALEKEREAAQRNAAMKTKEVIDIAISKAIEKAKEEYPANRVDVSAEQDGVTVELEADIDLPEPRVVEATEFMGEFERITEWDKPTSIDILDIVVDGCDDLVDVSGFIQ